MLFANSLFVSEESKPASCMNTTLQRLNYIDCSFSYISFEIEYEAEQEIFQFTKRCMCVSLKI